MTQLTEQELKDIAARKELTAKMVERNAKHMAENGIRTLGDLNAYTLRTRLAAK